MIIYYTGKFTGGREESHKLLKRALTVHTGDESQAEVLTGALKIGEHGKPYIEGFSCFSISHTGSIWAVLIADRECGLDIQLSKNCNYESISRRFFAPRDAEIIASLTDGRGEFDHKAEADSFFRIWTRREALVKALGGTVYDPDLPAVSDDCVGVKEKEYVIRNIRIPDIPELYAAICIESSGSGCDSGFGNPAGNQHKLDNDPEIATI